MIFVWSQEGEIFFMPCAKSTFSLGGPGTSLQFLDNRTLLKVNPGCRSNQAIYDKNLLVFLDF